MKAFIKDSIAYIKGAEFYHWVWFIGIMFWMLSIPMHDEILRSTALLCFMSSLFMKPNKYKWEYDVDKQTRDLHDLEYKSIIATLGVVLAELHDIKDAMKESEEARLRSAAWTQRDFEKNGFWTQENVDKFNEYKP